jgi:hypothetical protein
MSRPYRPLRELEAHLERGELATAIAVAKDYTNEVERPLRSGLAVRFLPLVASEKPDAFDGWGLRWLSRWCVEFDGRASIDDAVEIAAAVAEIPVDEEAGLDQIRAISLRLNPAWQ